MATTTTFAAIHAEIREIEGRLAPGGETGLCGDFVAAMARLGGEGWRESEAEVPADEAAWWRRAYQLHEGRPDVAIRELFEMV